MESYRKRFIAVLRDEVGFLTRKAQRIQRCGSRGRLREIVQQIHTYMAEIREYERLRDSSYQKGLIPTWRIQTGVPFLGQALFQARTVAGLTQHDLRRAGFQQPNVSQLEKLNHDRIELSTLRRWTQACGYEPLTVFAKAGSFGEPSSLTRLSLEAAVIRENIGPIAGMPSGSQRPSWVVDAMRVFLSRARDVMGAQSVTCYLFNPETLRIEFYYEYGVESLDLVRGLCTRRSLPARLLSRGKAELIRNPGGHEMLRESPFCKAEKILSTFVLPLKGLTKTAAGMGIVFFNFRRSIRNVKPEFEAALKRLESTIQFLCADAENPSEFFPEAHRLKIPSVNRLSEALWNALLEEEPEDHLFSFTQMFLSVPGRGVDSSLFTPVTEAGDGLCLAETLVQCEHDRKPATLDQNACSSLEASFASNSPQTRCQFEDRKKEDGLRRGLCLTSVPSYSNEGKKTGVFAVQESGFAVANPQDISTTDDRQVEDVAITRECFLEMRELIDKELVSAAQRDSAREHLNAILITRFQESGDLTADERQDAVKSIEAKASLVGMLLGAQLVGICRFDWSAGCWDQERCGNFVDRALRDNINLEEARPRENGLSSDLVRRPCGNSADSLFPFVDLTDSDEVIPRLIKDPNLQDAQIHSLFAMQICESASYRAEGVIWVGYTSQLSQDDLTNRLRETRTVAAFVQAIWRLGRTTYEEIRGD